MKLTTQLLIAALLLLAPIASARAQARVEKNVIYGMYSGLALLMDVHRPEKPNGYGVIFVAGSGWQMPLGYGYDVPALKERQIQVWGPPLLRAGYSVFTVNHRAAPRFHYPAALEDVQRAVRAVRHHAETYGVGGARMGGIGGSSGAHLVGLVAMLGAGGVADDPDPVNQEPATLQAVILRAGPTDLRTRRGEGEVNIVSFMDLPPSHLRALKPGLESLKAYTAASPIAHVSHAAPPVLLIHGDADEVVPFEQSVAMEAALRAVDVPTKLVRIPGGGHGQDFGEAGKSNPAWPDYFAEMVRWLDQNLKTQATTPTK